MWPSRNMSKDPGTCAKIREHTHDPRHTGCNHRAGGGGTASPRTRKGPWAPGTRRSRSVGRPGAQVRVRQPSKRRAPRGRSEEHTSELQSRFDLVCRLLLEKKKHYNKQMLCMD